MRALRSKLVTAATIGAAVLGGGAIANAATGSTGSSGSTGASSASSGSQAQPAMNMPAHGTAAHEDAEKSVTGTDAAKAQAAAVKAVGSGTAGTVTTDYTGNGYEVTVTKSDGSTVEVHLNSSLTVENGPGGMGGPGRPGAGGPPSGFGA